MNKRLHAYQVLIKTHQAPQPWTAQRVGSASSESVPQLGESARHHIIMDGRSLPTPRYLRCAGIESKQSHICYATASLNTLYSGGC